MPAPFQVMSVYELQSGLTVDALDAAASSLMLQRRGHDR
jgi:hypothetical protein